MKRYKILLVLLLFVVLLAACSTKDELVLVELEFLTLEKKSENRLYAIFSSEDEHVYYSTPITSYEYNNWGLEEGEKITVEKKLRKIEHRPYTPDDGFLIYSMALLFSSPESRGEWKAVWDGKGIVLYETVYISE